VVARCWTSANRRRRKSCSVFPWEHGGCPVLPAAGLANADLEDVFTQRGPVGWGGHYSTRSHEVVHHLDFDVAAGDVVVAYQTDIRAVVGFCRVESMKPEGAPGEIELQLQPIAICSPPCPIHDLKHGTPLEHSNAVNGPVMLWQLIRHDGSFSIHLGSAEASLGRTASSGRLGSHPSRQCHLTGVPLCSWPGRRPPSDEPGEGFAERDGLVG
jgi:hypothetical protein